MQIADPSRQTSSLSCPIGLLDADAIASAARPSSGLTVMTDPPL
jgi:hypothetical protein